MNIGDAIDMAVMNPDDLSKTRKENFGKGLRTFLLNMIVYMFNVYKWTITDDETSTADINEEDMKMDDVIDSIT